MTVDATAEPSQVVGVGPDFPVEFADPSHASLTWEWDDMHMPFALTPLAGDYTLALGQGFDDWKTLLGNFVSRTHVAVWNGYAYFGFSPNAEGEAREQQKAEGLRVWRERAEVTEAYWNDEVLPELKAIYAQMQSVPVDSASGDELAAAWEAAWAGAERAWRLHFIVILGPYQVLEDLADLYESITPSAPPGEAMRLVQGTEHELYETELGVERLTALATASPEVAASLRGGMRALSDLREVAGGEAFFEAVGSFLAAHGHMGQSVDDFALASWHEEPANLLAEIAKRLDQAPESAAARRARLALQANELADAARERLKDRPEDLARFNHLVELARRIGPITEVHNYWIDRAVQGHLRALSMRVGARLVREGVLAEPADILYLRRAEVPGLLRSPEDRQGVVEERKATHERQKASKPPRFVGKPPEDTGPVDRFDTPKAQASDDGVIRGTGGSAGIVRGPARVVLTSNEFDRIQRGDIIVCPSSNPSWVPVFTIAGGLVTNTGGVLSHAAVVAREFGLPAVVGAGDATTRIPDGALVEIDGTAGTVRLL